MAKSPARVPVLYSEGDKSAGNIKQAKLVRGRRLRVKKSRNIWELILSQKS